MESLGAYTAPHWDSVRTESSRDLAHFSSELLASARDKSWFRRDFNDCGVGRGGELSGDNDKCEVADGEEWRLQCQTLVERAHALADPLGFTNLLYVAARWQTSQDGFAQW